MYVNKGVCSLHVKEDDGKDFLSQFFLGIDPKIRIKLVLKGLISGRSFPTFRLQRKFEKQVKIKIREKSRSRENEFSDDAVSRNMKNGRNLNFSYV